MRKTYSPEYKAYVVKLILDEGRKGAAVARELEIPYGTLIRWTEQEQKKRNGTGPGEEEVPLTPSEYKKKLAAYEKELRSVNEENEILKKAMHIFTKNRE